MHFAVLHTMLRFTCTVQKSSVRPSTHLSSAATSALCNAAGFTKMLSSTHQLLQALEGRKRIEYLCEYLNIDKPPISKMQLNIVKNKKNATWVGWVLHTISAYRRRKVKKIQHSEPVITSLNADQEEPYSLSRHGKFSKQNLNSCGLQPLGKHQHGLSVV